MSHSADEAVALLDLGDKDFVVSDLFVKDGRGGLHVLSKPNTMRKSAPSCIVVTGVEVSSRDDENGNLFLKQAGLLRSTATMQKPLGAAELVWVANNLWSTQQFVPCGFPQQRLRHKKARKSKRFAGPYLTVSFSFCRD